MEASTVAEAIRSLKMIPELKPELGEAHHIRIEGVDSDIALFSETSMEEIHVYPLTGGAGGKPGLGQILLGIAIITVAFMFPPAAGSMMATMGITQGSLYLAGGMMIAGGLLQMLMPVPEAPGENKASKFLGASENTVAIGTPVTLAYGTNKLGGHYLSFDVDAVDYTGDAALVVGDVTLGQSNRLVRYDRVGGVALAVVSPIYPSPNIGPANIPTSGWTPS